LFRSHQADFERLGVGVAFVSTGLPAMAEDFVQQYQLPFPVFVDPKRETFRHLGFRRGALSTLLSLQIVSNARRAMKAGFRQGKTQGDAWQQGGVVIVRRGGVAVYGFASETAGHHPPLSMVLREAAKAV
jgi:hypothetical protein